MPTWPSTRVCTGRVPRVRATGTSLPGAKRLLTQTRLHAPRGSEGGPAYRALDPGKPATALLGAVLQMGKPERDARPGSHGDGASVLTSLWRGEPSPRAPSAPHPSFLLSPAMHPHGGGRTALPSSRRGGSEGPSGTGRAGGVPHGSQRRPLGEAMGAPPTHLLLLILQAVLTPAGHLSRHHSNPSCVSQPSSKGRMGGGCPAAWWGLWRPERPPSSGLPLPGTASIPRTKRCAPCPPHSYLSHLMLPRAQGVCTQAPTGTPN